MKLLVMQDNWADEIDFLCVEVLTDEEYKKFIKALDDVDWRGCFYIGTNEEVEYSDKKDFLSKIKVHAVPPECEKFVKKALGGWRMGPWPLAPDNVIIGRYAKKK